ncbi:MAG: orotate phosphoribosyltransferase [Ginsengibacter sp.]
MENKKAVAEKLLQNNAIKLSVNKPFTWASGWKSPIYCDNRKILSYPYARDFIKSEMCNLIFQLYPNVEMLAGVATAGIAWGAMVADQLKLPFIYVRPKAKEHGLGNQIEGYYEEGKKVVVVEDLISTGRSSLLVVDVLKNAGIEVEGLVSIFDYGFKEAVDSFKNANTRHQSLTDYDALVKIAVEKNIVSEGDLNTLLNWRADPANWNAKS